MTDYFVEVLKVAPPSGEYEEVQFNASSSSTFVKFVADGKGWVGVFGNGVRPGKKVVPFNGNRHAFVIADGNGYVVDVKTRQLTFESDDEMLVDVIIIPDREVVVACNHTDLMVFDPQRERGVLEQAATDQIVFEKADTKHVYGKLWEHGDWHRFVFAIDTCQIVEKDMIKR